MDYHGSRWKKKRLKILRRDKYICQYALMFGRTEEAQTVHHVFPVKEYPEYEWCDWNLLSVSNASHNKLENRKTGELTQAGKDLQARMIIGVGLKNPKKFRTC